MKKKFLLSGFFIIIMLLALEITSAQQFRTETDLLGDVKVPTDVYYGVQTIRALENFQISGQNLSNYPEYAKAWGMIKLAAARANAEIGELSPKKLQLIEWACQQLIEGKYTDQFMVDLYQGGAGTSSNMNANEVIANLALEKGGYEKGRYDIISSVDDVNMAQSTNDSYPTSLKLTMVLYHQKLVNEMKQLAQSFRLLGNQHLEVVKMGRTELQDAVPMTVGQEFHSFAAMLDWNIANIEESQKALMMLNMGGTAIGTGLNAAVGYSEAYIRHFREITGFQFTNADDMIAATSSLHGFVVYSSAVKTLAVSLVKISNDLILLSSGPRAGFFEINLPARQPGSSIMPGKVNPVIPELMTLISYRVMGNDVTVNMASSAGVLQLNAFEPVVGLAILESQKIMTNGMKAFREQCIDGITINEKVHARNLSTTIGIVTALNPILGHHMGDELAKEAMLTGKGILELVREKKLLTEQQIQKILNPENMTGLDKTKYKNK
ncbi:MULTISPECIES: aspartate ammonia-lyase [unclassified Carboxylicivirga]|uniref:aspartate ammonia-lyase n=1 Tax=Carboxylicivirga TaxID=1628153 RepID=UPI003D3505BD